MVHVGSRPPEEVTVVETSPSTQCAAVEKRRNTYTVCWILHEFVMLLWLFNWHVITLYFVMYTFCCNHFLWLSSTMYLCVYITFSLSAHALMYLDEWYYGCCELCCPQEESADVSYTCCLHFLWICTQEWNCERMW